MKIFGNFLKNFWKFFEKVPPPQKKNPGYAHSFSINSYFWIQFDKDVYKDRVHEFRKMTLNCWVKRWKSTNSRVGIVKEGKKDPFNLIKVDIWNCWLSEILNIFSGDLAPIQQLLVQNPYLKQNGVARIFSDGTNQGQRDSVWLCSGSGERQPPIWTPDKGSNILPQK